MASDSSFDRHDSQLRSYTKENDSRGIFYGLADLKTKQKTDDSFLLALTLTMKESFETFNYRSEHSYHRSFPI